MNYLQYTSKEMFSSTELIRKSKMIFEQLNNKHIEKAIILRDGKPSFMLLDFEIYEEIMADYMKLKTQQKQQSQNKVKIDEIKQEIKEEEKVIPKATNIEDIDDKQLQKALEDIENISFSTDYSDEDFDEVYIEEKPIEEVEKPLKEFWD
ncbi:hypothetical protein AMYT_0061 [Malaciobacter mytili LMG 24559]|uniref:hypothetical protein n=1 Tax=Malaciobacter mytili TaxID=603050 RepID=UPI000E1029ED|nr:hypothetical protein [Malaciobacter mytili]AXH13688.1 hypothetical protein AMYT_0061 [Malaciobacter mytili LMG 24559]